MSSRWDRASCLNCLRKSHLSWGLFRCDGVEREERIQLPRIKNSSLAAMLCQSDNILDMASASCGRSNCVLGFVNQHRVEVGHCRGESRLSPKTDGRKHNRMEPCSRQQHQTKQKREDKINESLKQEESEESKGNDQKNNDLKIQGHMVHDGRRKQKKWKRKEEEYARRGSSKRSGA